MRKTLVATILCASLELASLATVVAIGRTAPTEQSATPALRDCVRFVINGTPILRCPGG